MIFFEYINIITIFLVEYDNDPEPPKQHDTYDYKNIMPVGGHAGGFFCQLLQLGHFRAFGFFSSENGRCVPIVLLFVS